MTTEAKRDYYEVLGVDETATPQEIEDAFQKLETEFHASGKPKTIDEVEWLRKLVKAHDVLKDTTRRQHYDRFGTDSLGTSAQPVANAPSGYNFDEIKEVNQALNTELRARRISWMTNSTINFIFDLFRK